MLAAGYTAEQAKSGLRLSVGLGSTEADIDYALDVLVEAVGKLSRLQPGAGPMSRAKYPRGRGDERRRRQFRCGGAHGQRPATMSSA